MCANLKSAKVTTSLIGWAQKVEYTLTLKYGLSHKITHGFGGIFMIWFIGSYRGHSFVGLYVSYAHPCQIILNAAVDNVPIALVDLYVHVIR